MKKNILIFCFKKIKFKYLPMSAINIKPKKIPPKFLIGSINRQTK